MIAADQPTIFPATLIAAVSSRDDGNMKFGIEPANQVRARRHRFLRSVGIAPEHTTLVSVTYDTDDFAKYRIATHHDKTTGMNTPEVIEHADALAVGQPNHALFLPLADCVGAILYDPVRQGLMVSHLGRHSVEVSGGARSVEYLQKVFQSDLRDVLVWLSPAVGSATYPLYEFGGRGLHEVIIQQLTATGIPTGNIEASRIDTARNEQYFSHSEFLKGNRDDPGRFAIVAMMTAQGEPAA
ncbi:laccase domain-containing protein [Streptomyces caniscabiei]|uniref:laccase domain-containing protein n=1 Tax=Streptomyces caniscabiei TaxID=2746961 RepID=UPI0029A95351|nr:laccase domain-containing protein [Streptomyces caniscabiei]MDX2776683.1 laccase domain-containing protein [Streptomyces caniscabiei]